MIFDPTTCPIGKGYYFDAAPGPAVTSGWTNESTGAASDNLPAIEVFSNGGLSSYRHRITRDADDIAIERSLRQTFSGTPDYLEVDAGASLTAYHNTDGRDSNGFSMFSGLSGFSGSTHTWQFGIFYKCKRNGALKKVYTLEFRLVGNAGAVLWSQDIMSITLEPGDITYTYNTVSRLRVAQSSTNTFEIFVNGVSFGTYTDSAFTITSSCGVTLGQVAYSPGTFQEDYGWVDNFYAVGNALPLTCLGMSNNGAHGFEGWISVGENLDYDNPNSSAPQMLYADAETLSLTKEVHFEENRVRDGHSQHISSPILKAAKPQGDITYQFRSDDCLKFLLAHFQCGSIQSSTSPYRYVFYPRTNPLDYSNVGTYPNQAYGYTAAKPYTVTITKKLFDTNQNGGTNSFIFKNGIVDKLAFSLNNNSDAKIKPHLLFRDFDAGTAIPNNPGDGTVGTYSSNPPFEYWTGTVTIEGASLDLSNLTFESVHQAQEISAVNKQAPNCYQFSDYSLRGAVSFDLPYDALKYVGSMFSGGTFSLTATLCNSAIDQVVIEMPCCVRETFEYNFASGEIQIPGRIPFRAFENNGTYPIKITVDTHSSFNPLNFFGDAVFGARSIPSSSWYDAGSTARTLSAYTFYSHS